MSKYLDQLLLEPEVIAVIELILRRRAICYFDYDDWMRHIGLEENEDEDDSSWFYSSDSAKYSFYIWFDKRRPTIHSPTMRVRRSVHTKLINSIYNRLVCPNSVLRGLAE